MTCRATDIISLSILKNKKELEEEQTALQYRKQKKNYEERSEEPYDKYQSSDMHSDNQRKNGNRGYQASENQSQENFKQPGSHNSKFKPVKENNEYSPSTFHNSGSRRKPRLSVGETLAHGYARSPDNRYVSCISIVKSDIILLFFIQTYFFWKFKLI